MNLAARVEDYGAHFVVGQDLDLGGELFPGIGTNAVPFSGRLDGARHAIASVRRIGTDKVGFINVARGARISNLTLQDTTAEGQLAVGGLVGQCRLSQIDDVTLTNLDVRGVQNVGGLVGDDLECRSFDIALSGTVAGTFGDVGGVIGSSGAGTHVNVFSTVRVDAAMANRVGGALGYDKNNPVILQNVSVQADVIGNNSVGGLVGANGDGGHVYRSQFAGTVTGVNGVGGIVGSNTDIPFIVRSTSATGTVTGSNGVGGFTGEFYYLATFADSSFTGTLVGTGIAQQRFGGFAGIVGYYGRVERSYVDVTINSQAATVGGFIGAVDYWSPDATMYDFARSFSIANVTGSSPTATVSLWIGENTDPNPVVGAGSYHWAGGACTNQGGGSCNAGGMAIADKTQFQTPNAPPVATWDFQRVWQARTDGLPSLRLDQQSAPVVTATCPTHAIAGHYYECVVTISDADPNEAHVITLDAASSCPWFALRYVGSPPPGVPAVVGTPTLGDVDTCNASIALTDGVYTTPIAPFTVDVHAGVLFEPVFTDRGLYFSYDSQTINTGSYPQTFTITNQEAVPVALAMSGVPASAFSFPGGAYPGGGTCSSTLAAGASCTIVIAFTPTVVGLATTTLLVQFTAARGPVTFGIRIQGHGN